MEVLQNRTALSRSPGMNTLMAEHATHSPTRHGSQTLLDGGTEWVSHPDGDDVAVLYLISDVWTRNGRSREMASKNCGANQFPSQKG